jgi:hypothetical protein
MHERKINICLVKLHIVLYTVTLFKIIIKEIEYL